MFGLLAKELVSESLAIVERLDEYELVGTISPGSINVTENVIALLVAANGVSSRDYFEFHVTIDGVHKVVGALNPAALETMREHINENLLFEDFNIRLVIRKKFVNGLLSVYSIEDFGRYLGNSSVGALLDLLWSRFEGGLVFECFDLHKEFGTPSIRFSPRPAAAPLDSIYLDRAARELESTAYRENTHASGIKALFLPSDFKLGVRSEASSVNSFFDRACAALSVMFLANSSGLEKDDTIEYKMVGYKSILGRVDLEDLIDSLEPLYKIYVWAYSSGGNADKIGLARNVISLHVGDLDKLRDDGEVWNAIQSNYQIYLKGNIAAYLDVKSQIATLLVDTSTKAHSVAQGLVSSFKSGVALVTSFILGVVVVNGVKDSGVEGFFTLPYFSVLTLILVVISFWLWHEEIGARVALKDSNDTIRDILRGGFSKVLHESEIEDSLTPVSKRNEVYVSKEISRAWMFWRCLCAFVLLFFALGWIFFGGQTSSTRVADANNPSELHHFGPHGVNGCFWPNVPLLFPHDPLQGPRRR